MLYCIAFLVVTGSHVHAVQSGNISQTVQDSNAVTKHHS